VAKYTVQYRMLKTEGLPAGTVLKPMIIDYLRSEVGGQQVGSSARRRIVDLDQDGSVVILNKITSEASWDGRVFGGQLIQLEPGANVPAVLQSLEEDADEFLMEQIDLGADAQVVKGVLYFAVVDNHLGLIEGQAVKGRTLERYLTSIFERTGAIDAGQVVTLVVEFLAADGKQLPAAMTVDIAAVPNARAAPGGAAADVNELVGREVDRGRREGATVFEVLRALGWDDAALQRLEADVPEGGWVEGVFSIFIKERKRRKPISRATIQEALRNIDAADLGMDGAGKEKGGIVKVSAQRNIRMIGSLKDPEDAIEQIVAALREWAEKGIIDCAFD
jgi:hypothetical protein